MSAVSPLKRKIVVRKHTERGSLTPEQRKSEVEKLIRLLKTLIARVEKLAE